MLVPRYWARTEGAATDPKGKRYRLRIWGWSQGSASDARAAGRRRLAGLVARITTGEPVEAYAYDTPPLREEIVRPVGEPGGRAEAIVTRNRYGALILNTARVPFIDIDSAPAGLIARLRRLFRPDADAALERIRATCQRSGRHSFRIYRTAAGWRLLATDLFLDPTARMTREFLTDFAADPRFIKLCGLQGCFRARLTPKPMRCGCSRPPGRFPRDDGEVQRQFDAWLTEYESAAGRFASCRYVESIGSEALPPDTRAIVEEHDRVSRALVALPLA